MLNNGAKNPGIHLTYTCPHNVIMKPDSKIAHDWRDGVHEDEDGVKKPHLQDFKGYFTSFQMRIINFILQMFSCYFYFLPKHYQQATAIS